MDNQYVVVIGGKPIFSNDIKADVQDKIDRICNDRNIVDDNNSDIQSLKEDFYYEYFIQDENFDKPGSFIRWQYLVFGDDNDES